MHRRSSHFLFIAGVVLLMHPAFFASAQQASVQPRFATPNTQSVSEQPEAAPRLEPSQTPEVTYRNGQLAITALNCSLRDILSAVAERTGATLDVHTGAGDQRVVVRLGPGDPAEVLRALLEGSDYIILGNAKKPGALEQVIVFTTEDGHNVGRSPTLVAQTGKPAEASADDSPAESAAEGAQAEAPAEPAPSPEPASADVGPAPAPDASKAGLLSRQGDQPVQTLTPDQALQNLQTTQQQKYGVTPANPGPPAPVKTAIPQ